MKHSFSRRQLIVVGAVVLSTVTFGAASGYPLRTRQAHESAPNAAHGLSAPLERAADSLDAALANLALVARDTSSGDSAHIFRLRTAFYAGRTHYKHLEGVVEFYSPALAAALNSRRQEVDDDDAPPPSSLAPGGFPAIEAMLWGAGPIDVDSLTFIVRGMRHVVAQIRSIGAALAPTDAQLIELGRLELARISTLSIAGFDTPLTHVAMRESADAIDGLRAIFADSDRTHWSKYQREQHSVDATFASASKYLVDHSDFDTFDRLEFIAQFAQPAAHALDDLRRATGVVPVAMKRGWRADVASVYDAGAFDTRAYAADNAPVSSAALVALGQRLFSDPALSGNGKRACVSCHQPSHAFTDGLTRAAQLSGYGTVARHTPTLLNAALSPAQFADERAITIEEQVKRVVESQTEMGGSLDTAAERMNRNGSYQRDFALAFTPSRAGTTVNAAPITGSEIRFAVAAYVRSLVAMNSRFDKAVHGDSAQITAKERAGFNLFMGKAGCGTCHFAPMFNGNTPPLYLSADVEVIGVPANANVPSRVDSDSGRAAIDHVPLHLRAFKTPTVRNAALTAPFMHNGAYRSLDDVIRFYSNGGGAGAGARVPNQTLGAEHLSLTAGEREAIIAFIGSLTDTVTRR